MTGLEPVAPGVTNQCSNQLSYNHHVASRRDRFELPYSHLEDVKPSHNLAGLLGGEEGIEPPTDAAPKRCLLYQLSYSPH